MGPRDLVDSEVAALAAGVSARAIRKAVAAGRLRNHGTARRVLVSLDEVVDVYGDLLNLR